MTEHETIVEFVSATPQGSPTWWAKCGCGWNIGEGQWTRDAAEEVARQHRDQHRTRVVVPHKPRVRKRAVLIGDLFTKRKNL